MKRSALKKLSSYKATELQTPSASGLAVSKLVKIGEAAKLLGISIDTLRRWEKRGWLRVTKTPGGTRLYDKEQLSKLNPNLRKGPKSLLTPLAPIQPQPRFSGSGSSVLHEGKQLETKIHLNSDEPILKISEYIKPHQIESDIVKSFSQIEKSISSHAPLIRLSSKSWESIKNNIQFAVITLVIMLPLLLLAGYLNSRASSITSFSQKLSPFSNNTLLSSANLLKELAGIFSPTLSHALYGNYPAGSPPGFFAKLNTKSQDQLASGRVSGEIKGKSLSRSTGSVLADSTPSGSFLQINLDTQINGSLSVNTATVSGALYSATINTGFGDNEVYPMNQPLLTTSPVTFATLTAGSLSGGTLSLTSTSNQITLANTIISTQTGGSGAFTVSIPALTSNGNFVIDNAVQTLTNKTISGSSNTFESIPNSALSSSSITINAGSGLSGGGEVSLGGSITLTATGGSSSGVSSITGTADQVIASASTGDITLSLPQSIATTSSPEFANLTLSDLDANGVVFTTGAGLLDTVTTVSTGECLLSNGAGAPTWGSCFSGSTSFTLAGDSGPNQSISSGDTLTINGDSNIATLGVDTDHFSITLASALTGITSIDTIAVSSTVLTFAGAGTISSTTSSAITLDSGTTGTVNLGTGNNAKTINLGTGNAGNTINIGTDNTIADAINIGSALDTTIITGTTRLAGLTTNGPIYTSGGNGTLNSEAQLAVSRGGTGQDFSSIAQGSLPYFSATGTFSALAPSTAGYVLTTQGAGADPTWTDTGSLTVRWNTIDDPNGNQTLAMADYTTTWNWATADTETAFSATANALTSGTLFNLSSTSTAGTDSGNSFLLDLSRSGTNSNSSHTAYGIRSQVTNTGTTSTNIAGYFSASGATTNYALYAPSGYSYFGDSVGIGSNAPSQTSKLAVVTTGLATTLDVTNNNTGSTAYGARITKSGAATTGVGLYVTSSGATNNYAAIFDAGRVGIGDTTPDSLFDFEGAISGTPSSTGAWLNYTGSTFTDSATSGSGTATTFAANAFGQPTLAATNSNVTTTNAATVYIANAPAAGSNQTITAPLALLVDSGAARFDGHVGIGSGYNNAAVSSTSVLGISEAYTGSSSFRHVNLFGSHAPSSDNSNTQYAFASVLDLHSSATASLTGTVTAGLFQITNSNATQSIGTAFGSWIGTATSSGGAITNNYGLFIDDQTVGSSDYGLRIDAADTQTLWVGGGANGTTASAGIAFGSSRDTNLYRSAADTLKTDDAFTATGLITGSTGLTITGGTASINASGSSSTTIGNTSSDLTLTGNHINASMTLTDTSSGAKNGLSSTISLNPSGSSASQFRANSFSATVSSGNVQDFTDVIRGVYAETRHLGTGSINIATGVFSAGVVLPTAATSFGTITEINAFHALPVSEFASSAITGTVSTARGIYIENSAKANSSWAMTTQVGIDVSAMTSGSSDIGVRIAGADTYSLQLSSTAGTAASGITFGTDTNLYRSAADTLKTDDALTVSGLLTGSAGSTISGGTINLNASSNNPTNINTGTSTGAISIGNSSAGAIALSTGSTFGITTTTGSQTFTSANLTGTTTSSSYVFNASSLTSGTALYITSSATSGKTVDINASQTSGTVFNLAYGSAKTISGDLTGLSVDLNSGNVDATNQNITGVNFKIPTVTDTHTSGTKTLTGMLVNFGSGAGINQNGAGGTLEYVAGDFYMPALTQSAGTLNAYGTRVTTPATITTGGTAYGNYVSATGVGAGTLSGLGVSSITGGAGSEYALNIGSGWDAVLRVGSTTVINGSGVTVEAGGGTGQSTYSTGDMLYASGANTLAKRAIGNSNEVLTVVGGVPTWATISGASCSNCLVNDPTSDQTIAPTGQGTTGLSVRQTSTASPTDDIFQVTSSDGATKYFYVDKDGNVSTSATAGQTLTLTPTTDTTALTLVGTNVSSASLQYINSKNASATTGILNMAYGAAQTLTGTVIGFRQDLSTNVTATNQSVTGHEITLPGATNTSGTQNYTGLSISGGSINENGGTATTFTGASITVPALTQTSGTLTGYGVNVTTPSSITTAGTAYGLNVAATGVGAGSLYGLNISNITAGAGTEVGAQIGSGWDTNLLFNDTSTRVAVADGGTITILDTAGNSLCTITDNGSVGDLECTGTIGGSGTVGFWSRDAGTGIVSPSNANDVVAISSNKTSTPLLNLTSTGATSNAFTLTGNSITTGNLASLTGTGFTTGEILDITGTWAPSDGSTNEAIDINITHSPTSVADTFKGVDLSITDNTSLANSVFGIDAYTVLSGNAAKTSYGLSGAVTSSSTTADTLRGVAGWTTSTGAITTGTRSSIGVYGRPVSTAASTGGTLNMYGGYFDSSSTLSNPGVSDTSTNNIYGVYTKTTATLAADCTTNCTTNQYGLYVDNGNSDTDGTSAKYGIYINTQSGADTNYALYSAASANSYFAGNLGIGTTPSGAYRAQVSRSITSSDNSYDGNLSASATVSSVTDGYTYVGLNNYLTSTHSSNAATLRGIDAKAYFSSQMASEATVGVNSAYAIYAEKGITGSSPTGTISNAFGLHSAFYSSATGTPAVTVSNNYGLYITNQGTPSGSPSGISVGNAIGLYVAAQSGATSTNYAAVFAGGNVGIGDTSPASALTVGSGDLFQVNSSGAIAAVTGYTQASGAFAFSGGGNFSIDSAAFDVNTSGAISGVTTLTQSGLHTINQGSAIRSIDINDTAASPSTPVIDVNRTNNTGTPAITNAALYINDHSTNYLLGFETGTTDLLTFTGAGQLSLPVSGSGAGIILGGDANLYRSAADTLRTDDAFNVGGNFNVTAAGVISGATGLTSSGTINFSGLSASSGVYTDGSKNLTSTPPSSGTVGYWSRSGTTLSTANAGDNVTVDGTFDANGQFDIGDGGDTGTISSTTLDIDATGALQINSSGGAISIGNDAVAQAINIGTGAAARTITIGNTTGATALAFNSGTGSQTFTSQVVSGTTTTSAFVFDATSLTTGTGSYFTSDSITQGKLVQIATTGNTLTSGTLADIRTTSTALTGSTGTGSLLNLDWSPGSSTTATGDLFALNIGSNGTTTGKLFNILDSSSSIFSVSETSFTTSLPTSFTSAGDVSIAYDLQFTNPTASYIKSYSALTIQPGDPFGSSNLTLSPYNEGSVYIPSNVATAYGLDVDANLLSSGRAVDISSTSTAGTASGASYLLYLSRSGANSNTAHSAYGLYSTVTNTNATSGTNIAGYFSASGATTANYGVYVAAGNVNIQGLTASSGVYTDSSKNLTSTPPSSGTIGYWSRSGTALSPATAGDVVLLDNNTAYQMKDTGGVARSLVSLNSSDMQTFGIVGYNATYNGYSIDITSALPSGQTTSSAFDIKSSSDLGSSDELVQFGDSAGDFLTILGGGNVGIGDTSPDAALEIVNTTSPQLRIGYDDTTNYFTGAVSSAGAVTFNTNGSGAQFNFSDRVDVAAYLSLDNGDFAGSRGLRFRDASDTGSTLTGGGLYQANNDTVYLQAGDSNNIIMRNGSGADQVILTASSLNLDASGLDLLFPNEESISNDTNGVINFLMNNTTSALQIGSTGITSIGNVAHSIVDSSGALNIDSNSTGAINIGTGANAKTITVGNNTGATALAFTSGTGSQTFTSSVATTSTTSSAFVFTANSLTSGTGAYINSTSLTTGKLFQLSTGAANTLSSGTLADIRTTSTALTGSTGTGSLLNLDWSPGSSTTATGDLFSLNIGSNGTTTGKLFNILDSASSIFSVSETSFTTSLPSNFTAAGDTSIAYDINFTNPTASYIESIAPLYLVAGETFNSSNLNLQTYNFGSVVVDSALTTGTGTKYNFQSTLSDATANANFLYGVYSTVNNSSNTSSGTHSIYGGYFSATSKTTGTTTAIGVYGTASGGDNNFPFYSGVAFPTANTAGLCWDNSGESAIYDCNGTPTDLAENYGTSDSSIEAGDVVAFTGEAQEVLDPREGKVTTKAFVKKSNSQYQNDLVGIVSTNPNQTYGEDGLFSLAENPRPVSLTGRVPVKVSTENGPIAAGDYLTSSSTPGVAMKSTQPGVTIGRALSSYTGSGVGKVIVYVKTGFADPNEALANLLIGNNGQLLGSELNLQKITVATTGTFGGLVSANNFALNSDLINKSGALASVPVSADNKVNIADTVNALNSELNTLDSRLSTLDSNQASQSAQLAEARILGEQAVNHAQSLDEKVASTSANLSSLSSRIDELLASISGSEPQSTGSGDLDLTPPSELIATDSATFTNLDITENLSTLNIEAMDATISSTLKSLGETFLGQTTIAGDLSVDGTMSFTNGNSINAFPTLFFQNNPLASAVDFFNSKITLDKDGLISAEAIALGDQSLGDAVIYAGQTEVTIPTSIIKSDSKIFLTPTSPISGNIYVGQIVEGSGFKVKISQPNLSAVEFNWMIVQAKD